MCSLTGPELRSVLERVFESEQSSTTSQRRPRVTEYEVSIYFGELVSIATVQLGGLWLQCKSLLASFSIGKGASFNLPGPSIDYLHNPYDLTMMVVP